MGSLFCLVGKVGSGKSTYSAILKEKYNSVVFNADTLMYPLFGENLDRNTFDNKLDICINYIYDISRQILDNNISVVLDFGFWRIKDRAKIKQIFKDYNYKFIYFKIDFKEQEKRLAKRNKGKNNYIFSKTMIEELNNIFEEPDEKKENIILEVIE